MGEAFFTGVAGRIPFGGPDSADTLSNKVHEPDRLVLGERMEDHLRIGACLSSGHREALEILVNRRVWTARR